MTEAERKARAIAAELRERLADKFGERLRGVLLYGSYARGDADEGSDIDLLVVLDSVDDFWGVLRQIDPASSELSLRHDVTVSAIPVSEDELANPESALLHSASREGVLIG